EQILDEPAVRDRNPKPISEYKAVDERRTSRTESTGISREQAGRVWNDQAFTGASESRYEEVESANNLIQVDIGVTPGSSLRCEGGQVMNVSEAQKAPSSGRRSSEISGCLEVQALSPQRLCRCV